MTCGHNEQLGAGEESELACDLRLIQSKNVGSIIEFDFDGVETLGFDSPCLFMNHLGLEPSTVCAGDLEPENILEIVLDGVPAGRPRRKRKLKTRFPDVLYIGGDVKEMAFDARDRNGVIDVKSVAPFRISGRRVEEDKSDGERED